MLSLIESYFSVLMLFGASQAVLGIYLLTKDKHRPFANNMLALLMLAWGFSCYWFFAFITKEPLFSVTVTTFIGPMLALTLFPPVFLYVKYLFYEYKGFQKMDHLHFIPIYIYIGFTFYLFYDSDFSIEQMRGHEWYRGRAMVCSYFAMLQGPFYFIKTRNILLRRQKMLMEEFSELESRKLEWFQSINYGFALVFIIGGISTLVQNTLINPYYLYMAYHGVIAISLFYITLMIYKVPMLFCIKEPSFENYQPHTPFIKFEAENAEPTISFAVEDNQSLKERIILTKIEKVMGEQKLYKNPNFSLNDLAEAISETRNAISHALNNNLNKSFYNYINELRIEESKNLLSNSTLQHFTIEGIAAQSGFKTMSVFYRFFKEVQNVTPAVYRKNSIKP
jgi:AraC-like DNA-binding protein